MSEQKAPKVKLNGRQWLAVIVCGMAYNALGILQYLARDFYVIYKESNGLTDSQMGTIMTAVGIAAVIAYFYNGFVTDLVRPKIMMMFSCSVCVVLALFLLTNPGFMPSVVCFCTFALLPMWSPMAKLLASVSTEEESNQVFAWLDFFIGLSGLVIGFGASAAVARLNSAAGVRAILLVALTMNVLTVVSLPFIDKTTKADFLAQKKENAGGFNLKNILILFRDPDQWLAWLSIGLGYTGYIALTYLYPLLTDAFGMSAASVTAFSTINGNGVGLIAPLLAGALATRFGAVRSYFLWLGFYVVSTAVIIILPWQPAFLIIAVLCALLIAFSVKGRSAISSTVLTNCATPMFLFGTSVGIESLIMTIPDTFCYNIAGNMIEANGVKGYYYVFAMCFAFAAAGLVCCIILDRRLKAGKTSEWFMKQHQHAAA